MVHSLPEELTVMQLVKNNQAFMESEGSLQFTKPHQWALFLLPIFRESILTLSFHIHQSFPNSIFCWGSPTESLYPFHSFPTCSVSPTNMYPTQPETPNDTLQSPYWKLHKYIISKWIIWIKIIWTKSCTLYTNQPTNSMRQGHSWEATSHSADQEIPHLVWYMKVHYCLHKFSYWFLSYARRIHSL